VYCLATLNKWVSIEETKYIVYYVNRRFFYDLIGKRIIRKGAL
jgi:hypothetical protein